MTAILVAPFLQLHINKVLATDSYCGYGSSDDDQLAFDATRVVFLHL